jgi:hypothetical protein
LINKQTYTTTREVWQISNFLVVAIWSYAPETQLRPPPRLSPPLLLSRFVVRIKKIARMSSVCIREIVCKGAHCCREHKLHQHLRRAASPVSELLPPRGREKRVLRARGRDACASHGTLTAVYGTAYTHFTASSSPWTFDQKRPDFYDFFERGVSYLKSLKIQWSVLDVHRTEKRGGVPFSNLLLFPSRKEGELQPRGPFTTRNLRPEIAPPNSKPPEICKLVTSPRAQEAAPHVVKPACLCSARQNAAALRARALRAHCALL